MKKKILYIYNWLISLLSYPCLELGVRRKERERLLLDDKKKTDRIKLFEAQFIRKEKKSSEYNNGLICSFNY